MPHARAVVPTPQAARYLLKLCKHWRHKFAVEFDETRGVIPFTEASRAELSAGPDSLVMDVSHDDPAQIERLQEIVANHLQRFAENDGVTLDIRWTARQD